MDYLSIAAGKGQSVDWVAIGALVVAAYAAALSTWQEYQRRRATQPALRVTLSRIVRPAARIQKPEFGIKVANTGRVPVTITLYGILFPNEHLYCPASIPQGTLPVKITPGDAEIFYMPMTGVAHELQRLEFSGTINLIGFCKSAVDERFDSDPMAFPVDDVLAQ